MEIKGTTDLTLDEGFRFPWTGNSLGRRDLEFVASRARPFVLGVIGAQNAGKTTFLSVVYLLLSRGHYLGNGSFAGSYTLGGWEGLAHHLRWQAGDAPAFPPHTSRTAGRLPGLLHLSLREEEGGLRDVVFTDAPGEWFARWAVERDAADAEGGRWVHRNADAFLLIADSEALAGSGRGEARGRLQEMARRLGEGLEGRSVGVVWSKSDVVVPPGIKTTLRTTFAKAFGEAWSEFETSVHAKGSGQETGQTDPLHPFLEAVSFALTRRAVAPKVFTLPVLKPDDPLLAFRGKSL